MLGPYRACVGLERSRGIILLWSIGRTFTRGEQGRMRRRTEDRRWSCSSYCEQEGPLPLEGGENCDHFKHNLVLAEGCAL